jgi:Ankyrin repeats (many copies)
VGQLYTSAAALSCQTRRRQKIAELPPPVTARGIRPMPTPPGARFALLLACALTPLAARVDAGRGAPVGPSQQSARRDDAAPVAARREWEERRDWTHFTTRVLGDAAVTDSMKALLASGVGPDTRDRYGRTSLHAAVLLGQMELARFLLTKGADINARDGDGRTPLMVSASAGGFDHFRGFATVSPWGLLWAEPVCDLEGAGERSAAVGGFESWHSQVVAQRPMLRVLVEAGADVTLKDFEGFDVLDHAAGGGPTGLDRLLPTKTPAGEQSRCDLGIARSPEVRGLHLGMTLREVASRFGPTRVAEAEWCGRQTLEFDWSDDLLGQPAPRPRELAGVRRIRLGFLDGRLTYFCVTYDERDAPLTPEQFRSTLSSALALPGRWRRADGTGGWGQLHSIGCEGFVAVAGYESGPYLELYDTGAVDLLLRRREEGKLRKLREAEDEKRRRRRVFKP